jgi:hypothetical protein
MDWISEIVNSGVVPPPLVDSQSTPELPKINFELFKQSMKPVMTALGYPVNQNVTCITGTHQDQHPSMTIYHDRVHCHACGWGGDVYDVAGVLFSITDKVEQYNKIKQVLGQPQAPVQQVREIKKPAVMTYKKTWEYHFADGKPAFSVSRYEDGAGGKQFKQWYIDPATNRPASGQPIANNRPMYRLPEVIAADRIIVVEGEKCADVQVDGYVVTTWCGGANAVTKTDFSPLAGQR